MTKRKATRTAWDILRDPATYEQPRPILHDNGDVTIGPIRVGEWATNGKLHRFVAASPDIGSFNTKSAADLVDGIATKYEADE